MEKLVKDYYDEFFFQAEKIFNKDGAADFLLPEEICDDLKLFWKRNLIWRFIKGLESQNLQTSATYKRGRQELARLEEEKKVKLNFLRNVPYEDRENWREFFQNYRDETYPSHCEGFIDCLIEVSEKQIAIWFIEQTNLTKMHEKLWPEIDLSLAVQLHKSAAKDLFENFDYVKKTWSKRAEQVEQEANRKKQAEETAKKSAVKPPASIDDWRGCTQELSMSMKKWMRSTAKIFAKGFMWAFGGVLQWVKKNPKKIFGWFFGSLRGLFSFLAAIATVIGFLWGTTIGKSILNYLQQLLKNFQG